jgi:hypothetical protein
MKRPLRLAPLLLLVTALAAPARAADPDYSGLQALLTQYTRVLPAAKGQPWDARFDYEQLFIDERVAYTYRADRLSGLHTQLLAVDLAALTPAERRAWAINTYNLLVIERMVLKLLVPGRRLMRYDSPNQVRDDAGSFFAAPVVRLGGVDHSLTGFERRFVHGDTTADPLDDGTHVREVPSDPRLQFALRRAALCSGPQVPWVFRGDSLEAQLDRATRIALALPRFVRVDTEHGMVMVTNRFFQERADLGGTSLSGLMPFLVRHGTPALRKVVNSRRLKQPTGFFEPDWKLDQYDHPKPVLPGQGAEAPAGR